MSKMNYEVGIEGKSAETVAKDFLKQHGFVSE